MIFDANFLEINFTLISVDNFIKQYKLNNPKCDLKKLKEDLLYFKKLKKDRVKCGCGNPIWIIGSAIAGKGCFPCISGESDNSNDYEIG